MAKSCCEIRRTAVMIGDPLENDIRLARRARLENNTHRGRGQFHYSKPESAPAGIHEQSRAIRLSLSLTHTALAAMGLKDVWCRSEPDGVCSCRAAAVSSLFLSSCQTPRSLRIRRGSKLSVFVRRH